MRRMIFETNYQAGMSSPTRFERRLQLPVRLVACLLLMLAVASIGRAQVPATVNIADSLANAGGKPVVGTLTVTTGVTMISFDGFVIPAGQKTTVSIGPTGQFSIALVPNIGAAPSGSYYYADYTTTSARFRETWVVPQSSTTLTLRDVRVIWPQAPNIMIPAAQFQPPPNFFVNCVLRWTILGWICATDNLGAVSMDLEFPSTADTGKFQWKPKNNLTLTRVSCDTDQGSAQINFELRSEASPNSSGTAVLSAPLTCGSNTTASTTSFAVSSVPGLTPVALSIVGVSGSPLIVRVHAEYQLN